MTRPGQPAHEPPRRTASGLAGAIGLIALWLAIAAPVGADVYGDLAAKRYHHDGCGRLAALRAKAKPIMVFDSEAEAAAKGYYPCAECFPPVGSETRAPLTQRKLSRTVTRGQPYVGDREQHLYHYPWCSLALALPPAKAEKFADVRAAARAGYRACTVCNPPQPPRAAEGAESSGAESKPKVKLARPRSPRPAVVGPGPAPDHRAPPRDQEP